MYDQYAAQIDFSWLYNRLWENINFYGLRVVEAIIIVLAGWLIGRALGKGKTES